MSSRSNSIRNLYNRTTESTYKEFSPLNRNVHHGLIDRHLKSLSVDAMTERMNDRVIDLLDLKPNIIYTILDMGCGTGGTARRLANRYPLVKIYGISLSEVQINVAQKLNSQYRNQIFYYVANFQRMPFKNRRFDRIYAIESICHDYNLKSLKEVKRVLKPGGIMVISDAFLTTSPHKLNWVNTSLLKQFNRSWILDLKDVNTLRRQSQKNQLTLCGIQDLSFKVFPFVIILLFYIPLQFGKAFFLYQDYQYFEFWQNYYAYLVGLLLALFGGLRYYHIKIKN